MVAVSILLTLAVILIPQFSRLEDDESANNDAQILATSLRGLSTSALHGESYATLHIADARTYQLVRYAGGVVTSVSTVTLATGDTLSPTSGDLSFGQQGWVAVGAGPPVVTSISAGSTSTTVNGTSVSLTVYTFTVSAASHTYTVNVLANGHVQVPP